MKKLPFLFLALGLAASGFGQAADKPNIVYILADDMGYGDLSCFGQQTLKTPHIDQLAADGMKLTRHYAGCTVCAPSRCVLMTGLHTGHCTVRGNGFVTLKYTDVTVAQKLRDAGYRTGCFGKWGIGHPPPRDDPNRFGFDEFYGYANMHHAHNCFPEFLIRNGNIEKLNNVLDDMWIGKKDYGMSEPREGAGVAKVRKDYAPDLITNEALKFIESSKEEPFFLYLAFNLPHTNNEAGREPYNNGMEVPDYGEFASKDWPDPEKGFARAMQLVDSYVAGVVAKLDELGLSENTLVIFSSDNGPHQEGNHDADFFDSNGILRGIKRDLYEGGVRVPTIAKWPGKIAAGSESDFLSGFQDVFPTLAEVAGAETPGNLDGISILPTLLGEPDKQVQRDALYWEFEEKGGKNGAVTAQWKAVQLDTAKPDPKPTELYDLTKDPSEQSDVAADHPEVVKKLEATIRASHTPPVE